MPVTLLQPEPSTTAALGARIDALLNDPLLIRQAAEALG
jgi:hypothetical protein